MLINPYVNAINVKSWPANFLDHNYANDARYHHRDIEPQMVGQVQFDVLIKLLEISCLDSEGIIAEMGDDKVVPTAFVCLRDEALIRSRICKRDRSGLNWVAIWIRNPTANSGGIRHAGWIKQFKRRSMYPQINSPPSRVTKYV